MMSDVRKYQDTVGLGCKGEGRSSFNRKTVKDMFLLESIIMAAVKYHQTY